MFKLRVQIILPRDITLTCLYTTFTLLDQKGSSYQSLWCQYARLPVVTIIRCHNLWCPISLLAHTCNSPVCPVTFVPLPPMFPVLILIQLRMQLSSFTLAAFPLRTCCITLSKTAISRAAGRLNYFSLQFTLFDLSQLHARQV